MKNLRERAISSKLFDEAAALGFVTQILFQTPRNAFRLAAISSQVWPAIRLGQIDILFTNRGVAIGYAIWAFLSDEVSLQVSTDANRILHLSEWNEGANLWIMDFVATRGSSRQLAAQLAEESLITYRSARAIRRNSDGSIKRIMKINLPAHARGPDSMNLIGA